MIFYDTYALFCIYTGSESYSKYLDLNLVYTTKLNLLELYFVLLRVSDFKLADEAFRMFTPFCVNYSDQILKDAANLKFKLKRRSVSYIDCIGYCVALEQGIPFLTGDRAFENMENVLFVI